MDQTHSESNLSETLAAIKERWSDVYDCHGESICEQAYSDIQWLVDELEKAYYSTIADKPIDRELIGALKTICEVSDWGSIPLHKALDNGVTESQIEDLVREKLLLRIIDGQPDHWIGPTLYGAHVLRMDIKE